MIEHLSGYQHFGMDVAVFTQLKGVCSDFHKLSKIQVSKKRKKKMFSCNLCNILQLIAEMFSLDDIGDNVTVITQ